MTTEKRKYSRYKVSEMDLEGEILFSNEVMIHDISLGGVCISSERKLSIGREYTFEATYGRESVQMKVVVMWEKISDSRKNKNGDLVPIYTIGLKFKDVLTPQANEVMNFLMTLSRDESLRLTGIRFRFVAREKGTLSYPENYHVKVIGEGGILISLDQPLEKDRSLPMELYFPKEDLPVLFTGRVASCQPEKGSNRFEIGVEFIKISEKDKARLVKFIKKIESEQKIR